MTIDPTVTRRALLVAGAGGAGAVVLAACSSGSGGSGGSGGDSSTASSPEPANSGDRGASSPPSGRTELTALRDIDVGSSKSVKLPDGKPAIVTRTAQGTAVCFSAICTHEGCTVKPAGAKLDCPCHGSQYDAKTGKVLGPAPSPLATVAVKIVGGNVVAT